MTYSLDRTVRECFLALCDEAGTPLSHKASCALKREDWLWLASIDVRPSKYTCSITCAWDLQIAAFFKKYSGLETGVDLKRAAVCAFWDAEKQCYWTNERLNPLLSDLDHYGVRLGRVIRLWRKEIRRVLGPTPSLESVGKHSRFGPGSTFLNQKDYVLLPDKLSDYYTLTRQASTFLELWDKTAWSRYAACSLESHFGDPRLADATFPYQSEVAVSDWAIRSPSFVRGNRFTSVKKDSKKNRGICIEPSINLYFQLGLGGIITQRLGAGYKWFKKEQPSYHQVLARIGSLTGAIATIDLKSASDTVAIALVRLLLPKGWFELLNRLRSPYTLIDERWVRLEKFSSMGNGYTFELETLLFYTLVRVIESCEGVREDPQTPGLATSVFGDDIIVPRSISKSVMAALSFFGFTTNEDKTFVDGPFRESCGGDYHRGRAVRGYYVPEEPDSPAKLLAMANGVQRFRSRMESHTGKRVGAKAWSIVVRQLPRAVARCRGPELLGDLVLQDENWEQQNPIIVRNSIRYVRVWRPVHHRKLSLERYWRPGVVLATVLYNAGQGTERSISAMVRSKDPIVPEQVPRINGSYVSGYRFGRVAYS